MRTVTYHNQAYEYLDWEGLGSDIFALAKQIMESGEKFDRIVALAKGGLTFSRSLVDYLDIPEVSTLQIQFYTGIGETAKTPVITQTLPVSVRDERILVFDDIADTGETLEMATKYLQYHGVKSIKTAVLVSKPWSSYKPDFSAQTSEAWVIFPNEARETIATLKSLWSKAGDSNAQISKQLLEIGFSEAEVALFANLK